MAYREIGNIAIDYEDPVAVLERAEREADNLNLPGDGIFDWLSIRAVGDFAAAHPGRWRVISLKLSEPGLSQAEIARKLGMNQATVSRYLKTFRVF